MKKVLVVLLALLMIFSLVACGAKEDPNQGNQGNQNGGTNQGEQIKVDEKNPVGFQEEADGVHFVINKSVELTKGAWLGVCPKGEYVKEVDADEVDEIYVYQEENVSDNGNYVFIINLADLEDNDYTMVLCDNDDSGFVICYWPLKVKNGKATISLDKMVVNNKEDYFDEEEYNNLEIGVTEDGEDIIQTLDNNVADHPVKCVAKYDYEDGELKNVFFTYYLTNKEDAKLVYDTLLKDSEGSLEDITLTGTKVTCKFKEKELVDFKLISRDMLLQALQSVANN